MGASGSGRRPTPGAAEAIAALRAAGKQVIFLTNDGRRSPEEYVRKLWSLGVQASIEEVVTVGAAVQYLLAGRERTTVYVIGSQALFKHVADAGHRIANGTSQATEAALVVVASHDEFDYRELTRRHAGAPGRGGADRGQSRPHVSPGGRSMARHRRDRGRP